MSFEDISAFPLSWPIDRPRSKYRTTAKFGVRWKDANGYWSHGRVTMPAALDRLTAELRRFHARSFVVSTNLPAGRGGMPLANRETPADGDPGVAVYFVLEGDPICLSCDKWNRVADNINAIALHIDAIRGQLRWGVADVRRAFAGFKALPAIPPWWKRLELQAPVNDAGAIRARVRELALAHHPDRGGSSARMAEITAAAQEGMAELERRGAG